MMLPTHFDPIPLKRTPGLKCLRQQEPMRQLIRSTQTTPRVLQPVWPQVQAPPLELLLGVRQLELPPAQA